MTKTLALGDLIGVAYNNYIWPAIYMGKGKAGNFHFYLLSERKIERIEERLSNGKKPYIDYINRLEPVGRSPLVKISLNDLEQKDRSLAERCLFILKNGGLI